MLRINDSLDPLPLQIFFFLDILFPFFFLLASFLKCFYTLKKCLPYLINIEKGYLTPFNFHIKEKFKKFFKITSFLTISYTKTNITNRSQIIPNGSFVGFFFYILYIFFLKTVDFLDYELNYLWMVSFVILLGCGSEYCNVKNTLNQTNFY